MVSFQRLFLFSTLLYLSSADSSFNFTLRSPDTSLYVHAVGTYLNIASLTIKNPSNPSYLFKLNKIGDSVYSIESTKFSGYFLHCKGLGCYCVATDSPTEFRITKNDDRSYDIARLDGLKLTVGKFKKDWLDMAPSNKTLNQRFVIAAKLD